MVYFATLNDTVAQYSYHVIVGTTFLLVGVLFLAHIFHDRFHLTKKYFFLLIASAVVFATIALLGGQFSLISASETNQLERRTARFALYVCGENIQLRPDGFLKGRLGNPRQYLVNNLIVTQTYVTEDADVSFGSFMQAIGGSISSRIATVPASSDLLDTYPKLDGFIKSNPDGSKRLELNNGVPCDTQPSSLNVHAYRYDKDTKSYVQARLTRPEKFLLSEPSVADFQDCIVIDFSDYKDKTEQTCQGYPDAPSISVPESRLSP